VLEAVVGAVAVVLVLIGIAIMIGPALPGLLRLPRRRSIDVAPRRMPEAVEVHPTTAKALSGAERLAELLLDQGLKRPAAVLSLAGARLRKDEASGIYAMQDALRAVRQIRLDDPQDQEIFRGLVTQVGRALDDRAEQLELLPRG
jgi:hypothetical protein